jgi:hypothetical protein
MRGLMKFLAIAFPLTLASSAAAQLQSYTVTVAPGFNSIANHLDNGANTLGEVLPSVPEGTQLFKWNARTQGYREMAEYIDGQWFTSDRAMETLSPGEGAFLGTDKAFSLTFRGVAHLPQVRHDTAAGYNLVSCQTTQRCSFEELFGFAPVPGDRVYKLRQPLPQPSNNPEDMASSIHRYTLNGWDSVPSFDPGRSAFVYLAKTLRIVDEPDDQTVLAGTSVQMSVHAIGEQPLSYEWRLYGHPLSGQTGSTLTFQPVALSNAGAYRVVVSNSSGAVTSRVARLNVLSPPRIVEQPQPLVRILGQSATFKVLAEGNPQIKYQWIFNSTALAGETNAMLTIPSVSPNHQGKYSVAISNSLGTVTSLNPSLTVLIPPFITSQPKSANASINDTVTFFVEAGGTQPLRYQWLRNGVLLPGETNVFLRIQGVQPQDGASYRVVVANVAGSVQSDMAFLRVNVPFRQLADQFADAPLFRESAALFRSSNRGATREVGEPLHAGKHGGKSVWFAWMSEQEGIVTFRTRGSHVDTLLAAYVGGKVDQLIEIASDEDSAGFLNSEISFNVARNTPYMIAIDGYNGSEGDLLIEWFFEPTAEKLPVIIQQPVDQVAKLGGDVSFMVQTEPPNLSVRWFFNGQEIPGVDGSVLTLRSVRPEQAGLYYAAIMDGRRATISRMVSLQFSMVGPNNDVLPFFSRDKFGDIVVRPQQFAGLAPASAMFPAMAMAGPPPVHGYAGTHLFSTFGAIKEEGEPDHCGIPGGASYWFSYVPPASGQLFLNTDGSSYDTVLAVYTATGTAYSNLVEQACDNNSGTNGLTSSLNFAAAGGVTYYMAVDGVGAATGLVQLNYKLLVPMTISDAALTNSFRFRVTATPFLPFTIQRSSNFSTWSTALSTNTATGIYDYLDTNSGLIRFYRVMQLP